jgi:uncharacterized Zn finger protein (UPF0148 family)
MNCKNCLAPLSKDDTYCKVCGTPVEQPKTNYPSNEDIIAAYNQPEEPKTQTIFPSQETIEQMSEIKPVQTLEETAQNLKEEVNEVRPEPQTIINKSEGISKKIFALGIVIAVVATALITSLIFIPITSGKVEDAKKEVESETITKIVTENRVLLSGYSFEIPEGYSYKINGSQLLIQKDDTLQAMSLQVGNATYTALKADLTTLKTNLTTAKWTVGKISLDQTINNRVYLTVQATVNKQKVMIAYTKANATQTFGIIYLDPNTTEYPEETIKDFNDIIESAEEVTNTYKSTIATFTQNKLFFTTTTNTTTSTNTTKTN